MVEKFPGRGVDHSTYLEQRFKKEQRYTYNLSVGLDGLFYDEMLRPRYTYAVLHSHISTIYT